MILCSRGQSITVSKTPFLSAPHHRSSTPDTPHGSAIFTLPSTKPLSTTITHTLSRSSAIQLCPTTHIHPIPSSSVPIPSLDNAQTTPCSFAQNHFLEYTPKPHISSNAPITTDNPERPHVYPRPY
ncbi:hypothetical protein Salat_0674200 [Sesamum alatum]|uniref:Uncharacterized protein n=1 Tax=Sesamum alatum TaxID=300844 RepID=A0AAE2CUZ5_9LAMI|nr:hypothetical protein Salat_0674200 [Sesamum alatum]